MEYLKLFKHFKDFSLIKSLYLNFKFLPIRQALKLPIICAHQLRIRNTKGNIILPNKKVKFGMVKLGFDNVSVFDNKRSRSILSIGVNSTILINGKVFFGNGCKLCVDGGGKLVVNEDVIISAESTIICYKHIVIGNGTMIGWDCLIMDTDFHPIYDLSRKCINIPQQIILGDHSWIGCRCIILKGSVFPCGSILAAGSLLTKKLKCDNSIYGGSPVHLLKEGIRWEH